MVWDGAFTAAVVVDVLISDEGWTKVTCLPRVVSAMVLVEVNDEVVRGS